MTTQDREKFDAFMKRHNPRYHKLDDSISDRFAWELWQAALQSIQPAIQAEPLPEREGAGVSIQAEPVTDDIVAGALYDFLGYLTTRRTRVTMSDRDEAGPAVDALIDWSKTRKINLTEARVLDWNSYTTPPEAA